MKNSPEFKSAWKRDLLKCLIKFTILSGLIIGSLFVGDAINKSSGYYCKQYTNQARERLIRQEFTGVTDNELPRLKELIIRECKEH